MLPSRWDLRERDSAEGPGKWDYELYHLVLYAIALRQPGDKL